MTEDNKPRAGRRTGEAAVIVISILLAFAIDALWAQQQRRVEEREILAALAEEFAANLEQIDGVIAVYESGKQWVERMVSMPEDSIRALPQTSIRR